MRNRTLGLLLIVGLVALTATRAAGPREPSREPSTAIAAALNAARVPVAVSVAAQALPTRPASQPTVNSIQACEEVPLPRPLRADPLPTLSPLGRIETVHSLDFTDDYLHSPSDEFKIGTRREWGSTVIFYGESGDQPGMNSTNTIDANDTGRELQVALYDYDRAQQGCAWNATCLERPDTSCGSNITYMGWNPVQGGDECNRGTETDNVLLLPGRLEATLVPRFWNPDWQLKDCRNTFCDLPIDLPNESDVRYRQRLRFVASHAVEMFMEYTNLSNIDHAPAVQEFPTLYSSYGKLGPDLWKVVDSEGNHIKVDEPAQNNNFFRKRFTSPGGFATLQNSRRDYGVGLYYENRQSSYQAWQRRGEFNNFRARVKFGLPARSKVRGRAYLMIGSFKTIANTVRLLDKKIGPFGGLDAPLPDAIVGRKLTISGWALDNWDVTRIDVRLDGKPLKSTTLTKERPDVCNLWPGYEMCERQVGFVVEADLSKVSRCPHLLEVRATDTHGNNRPIARQRIFVKNRPPCQGPDCDPSRDPTHAIYRFSWSNGRDRDHQLSRTDELPPDYSGEGQKFRLFTNPGHRRTALWQTWCAQCTDHMPTFDAEEGAPLYSGPVLLGYCSKVKTPQTPRQLRRLNSGQGSDHFMSVDPAEIDSFVAEGYAKEGYCWIP